MKRPQKLGEAEINDVLKVLPGWALKAGKLHRVYKFKDFSEAFGFMTRCALVAEKLEHHPDWINVYSTVTVNLVTHDAGGVTELDLQLAGEFEKIFKS